MISRWGKKLDCFALARNDGFTLAEVLITLGIIGVVAAMTIPNLISKWQEQKTVTTLKKEVSILNQSFRLAIANEDASNNDSELEDYTYGEGVAGQHKKLNYIVKYLKVAQDCGYEAKGCFDASYYRLHGGPERDFEHGTHYYKLVLMDGSSFAMRGYEASYDGFIGEIWIDTNGTKKPNTVGKDIFVFSITEQQQVEPYAKDTYNGQVDTEGHNAANWVLQQGNLNYLKK